MDTDSAADSCFLWTVTSTPKEVSLLAIHKKKVDEVQEWLAQFCVHRNGNIKDLDDTGSCTPKQAQSQKSSRARPKSRDHKFLPVAQGGSKVLLLKGPPGCGKSTVVRVVAQSLGLSVHEWMTPVPTLYSEQQHLGSVSDLLPYTQSWKDKSYVSKLDAFVAFLKSSTKFAPLQIEFQAPEVSAIGDTLQGLGLDSSPNNNTNRSRPDDQHEHRSSNAATPLGFADDHQEEEEEDVVLLPTPLNDKRRPSARSRAPPASGTKQLRASNLSQKLQSSDDERTGTAKKPRQRSKSLDGAWGSLAFLSQTPGSHEIAGETQECKGDAVSDLAAIRVSKRSRKQVCEDSEGSEECLPASSRGRKSSQHASGKGTGKRKSTGTGCTAATQRKRGTPTRKKQKSATELDLISAGGFPTTDSNQEERKSHMEEDGDVLEIGQDALTEEGPSLRENLNSGPRPDQSISEPFLARARNPVVSSKLHSQEQHAESVFKKVSSGSSRPAVQSLSRKPAIVESAPALVLLDDFPFVATRPMLAQLCSLLHTVAKHSAVPVVVIMSEPTTSSNSSGGTSSGSAWDDTVKRAISAALEDGGAHTISFNPLTSRMIVHALTTIATAHMGNQWASDYRHEASLSAIAESSGGDLRRAVCQLQLMIGGNSSSRRGYVGDLRGPGKELWPWDPGGAAGRGKGRSRANKVGKGRKGKGMARHGAGHVTTQGEREKGDEKLDGGNMYRDHSLTLFHAIGKILHNRRKQAQEGDEFSPSETYEVAPEFKRAPPDMEPAEDILNQAQLEAPALCSFLQENYLDFIDQSVGLDDAARAAGYMSDAMVLLSGPRIWARSSLNVQTWSAGDEEACAAGPNFAAAAAASVAARGLLFSNAHPAPSRFQAIRPPAAYTTEKRRKEVQSDIVHRVHNRAKAVGAFPISIASFIVELYSGQNPDHETSWESREDGSIYALPQSQVHKDNVTAEEEDDIEMD